MAEQWIDAATARRLVAEELANPLGTDALCQRAHAGLVRTRARLLVRGSERAEDVPVPREFWQSTAAVDLDTDWMLGDFSARIDRTERWQAFGVSFALSGLLEMLPLEQRAITARQLSVAGNPAWVTARAARRFAFNEAGLMKADKVIVDHARLGFVTARAVQAEAKRTHLTPRFHWIKREWDIPIWFWRAFTVDDRSSQDWERGVFEGDGVGPDGRCDIRLEGVHFLAESLQVLVPASDSGSVAEADNKISGKAQSKGGGQPPRAFWDEMLCDVWALIHQGDFKPKRQADVERAMLTWAERKGEKLSEATARPKARLLFERYRNEAKNFLVG